MTKFVLTILSIILSGLTAFAQTGYDTYTPIPRVNINDRSITLQNSLFPEYYQKYSAASDMNWIQRNDSLLKDFWTQNGSVILENLSRLSGIRWHEEVFDIYFVRYFPDIGEGEPVIIPLGGIKQGQLTEATPDGCRLYLNLIYQLARRMLAQTVRPGDNVYYAIADHPLMRPGPFRRDNLAMLLAVVTGQYVMGLDSTYNAFQSAFWQRHFPGREIFNQYLLNEWILSPENPLTMWIAREPYNSHLVLTTRPPRVNPGEENRANRVFIEGLPTKGQLGFSVKVNQNNRLEVDKIDMNRLAYACGLQQGDEIRQVDNIRPRTQKELIERILEGLEKGRSTLQIMRGGLNLVVLIQPRELFSPEDSFYWDRLEDTLSLPLPDDTTFIPDSLAPDSGR